MYNYLLLPFPLKFYLFKLKRNKSKTCEQLHVTSKWQPLNQLMFQMFITKACLRWVFSSLNWFSSASSSTVYACKSKYN